VVSGSKKQMCQLATGAAFALAAFVGASATAQTPAQTSAQSVIQVPGTTDFISKHLLTEIRSDDLVNQAYKLQDKQENYLSLQQEARLGWKFDSGWQLFAVASETLNTYGSNAQQSSSWADQDASLDLVHPIVKNDNLTMSGELRRYFRGLTSTIQTQTDQYQYYYRTVYHPSAELEIYNNLSPHYFVRPTNLPTSVTTYFEERSTATWRMNKFWGLGVGQYTQLENHASSETGLSVEVYPAIELDVASNVIIWPTIYLPVVAQAAVAGGATSAALDNARAEIYVIITR
jgi:hypothetical protein